jgi:hypothetical protein
VVDVPRGKLILLHERMTEGFDEMAAGMRILADQIETKQASHEEVAAVLREIANNFADIAGEQPPCPKP